MDFLLIDNINNLLKDDLKKEIKNKSKLSIASAYFSIYAFEELKKELENIEELRFIFTSPTFIKEKIPKEKREFYIPRLNREKSLYGTEFEIKLKNTLSQKAIAKECADWIRHKVCFKSNNSNINIQGMINIEQDENKKYTYYPLTGFSTTELGCEKGNNCSYINRLSADVSKQYIQQFNEFWNDDKKFQDITDEIISSIETVYNENTPEFIYFFALYNIFHEFIDNIDEDFLPNEKTGFKESKIWNKLYDFQKDACLAIINKLEKYNGCILADSVGLGKTYTALSVIKYYESRNKNVLVLCPKKLADNWTMYKNMYVTNPIAEDRLRYDVLYHTDLTRTRGKTGEIDLSQLNWSNYDLIVIDESHNFRNGGKIYSNEEEKQNRYSILLNKVIRKGVRTKVLMLSATPVNNRFIDLKNQLALAYEGNPEEINEKLGEDKNINSIFKHAQTAFNEWNKLPRNERTTQTLLKKLDFDFFELLDSVTIARSKKHIQQYYNTNNIGKFPEKLEPTNIMPNISKKQDDINYDEIYKKLCELRLCIYTPSHYIYPSQQEKYKEKYGYFNNNVFLGQLDREIGLAKLMARNLLKRIESSVYSFSKTIEKIISKIDNMVNLIDKYEFNHIGNNISNDLNSSEIDEIDEIDELDDNTIGEKVSISINDIDYISYRRDLLEDVSILKNLLYRTKTITGQEDNKLSRLIETIQEKITLQPYNTNNKKIIIFTAFSDTAEYIYDYISNFVKNTFDLETALITGTNNKSTINKTLNMNEILVCFSPNSKEKNKLEHYKDLPNIDILIATDCISEGQNLQDCDCVINYDIHWNPVRIIQRFGRIDRLGSINRRVKLINFWPPVELDKYLQLKQLVEGKIQLMDITSAGDNNVITQENDIDLEYRKEQLQRLQKEVVDIEDMNSGLSIMDLGLNEFRLDLMEYIKQNPDFEKTPTGMHAVVGATKNMPEGVIYILKNINTNINIDSMNRLHPFYMVYIKNNNEIVFNHLQPKELLDKLRLCCKFQNKINKKACANFNKKTKDGRNMKQYSELLHSAIQSIIQIKEEKDIDSLFSDNGTTALQNDIKGLNDFELICFLVIENENKEEI